MTEHRRLHHSALHCYLIVALLLSLGGCASATASQITAQSVLDEFGKANLAIANVSKPPVQDGLPQTYSEHLHFTIAQSNTDGGDVFICSNRQSCAAIYDHFAAVPTTHVFQGSDGLVLVRLDASVDGVLAAQFQAVIDQLDRRPADD